MAGVGGCGGRDGGFGGSWFGGRKFYLMRCLFVVVLGWFDLREFLGAFNGE